MILRSVLERINRKLSTAGLYLLIGFVGLLIYYFVLTSIYKNNESFSFVLENVIHSKRIVDMTGGERGSLITAVESGWSSDLPIKKESSTQFFRYELFVIGKIETVKVNVTASKVYGRKRWKIETVFVQPDWPIQMHTVDITDDFLANEQHQEISEVASGEKAFHPRSPVDNFKIGLFVF